LFEVWTNDKPLIFRQWQHLLKCTLKDSDSGGLQEAWLVFWMLPMIIVCIIPEFLKHRVS